MTQDLTAEQALGLLPDGDLVSMHTSTLIAVDMDRAALEDGIRAATRRGLAGDVARSFGHGLIIELDERVLFVATDLVRLQALEESLV